MQQIQKSVSGFLSGKVTECFWVSNLRCLLRCYELWWTGKAFFCAGKARLVDNPQCGVGKSCIWLWAGGCLLNLWAYLSALFRVKFASWHFRQIVGSELHWLECWVSMGHLSINCCFLSTSACTWQHAMSLSSHMYYCRWGYLNSQGVKLC